jgi:hypothetical protein
MNRLAAQQRALAQAITAKTPAVPGTLLRLTPQGEAPHLDIYRHAYRARLTDALRENYPVLHRLLGDDTFDEMAEAFIAARPSHQPSIRWFGSELADFLNSTPEHAPHPAAGDLARMEWALCTAFDAADARPLNSDALRDIAAEDWPTLRFTAHPSLRLVPLAWNIEVLWSALSADENADTEAPEALQHHLVIWRHEGRTQWRAMADDEAGILADCLRGEVFATWCENAAANHGDNAAAKVAGYLRLWIDSDMLAGVSTEAWD